VTDIQKANRLIPIGQVRVQKVILSYQKRGEGIAGDPVRQVLQVWLLNGDLLAENDPFPKERFE